MLVVVLVSGVGLGDGVKENSTLRILTGWLMSETDCDKLLGFGFCYSKNMRFRSPPPPRERKVGWMVSNWF